jgi:hypothetical protein
MAGIAWETPDHLRRQIHDEVLNGLMQDAGSFIVHLFAGREYGCRNRLVYEDDVVAASFLRDATVLDLAWQALVYHEPQLQWKIEDRNGMLAVATLWCRGWVLVEICVCVGANINTKCGI